MAWIFDQDTAMLSIANMIESMVGTDLSFLPLADGNPSTERSIIIGFQSNPEPELPFIVLNFEESNDNDGFLLDSGVVEEEDPNDIPNLAFFPFFDKILNYSVTLRCEGENSHQILSKVRRLLLLDRFKEPLRTEIFSSIKLIQPIIYTPDALSDTYRDVNTLILELATIDRLIDFDQNGGVYDTIEGEGTLKDNEDDTDPLITNITVGSVTP